MMRVSGNGEGPRGDRGAEAKEAEHDRKFVVSMCAPAEAATREPSWRWASAIFMASASIRCRSCAPR